MYRMWPLHVPGRAGVYQEFAIRGARNFTKELSMLLDAGEQGQLLVWGEETGFGGIGGDACNSGPSCKVVLGAGRG
jgi:hypothetical protein